MGIGNLHQHRVGNANQRKVIQVRPPDMIEDFAMGGDCDRSEISTGEPRLLMEQK